MSVPVSAIRILFVSPKRHAQPFLSQLRSSGHQVSLVEDLDEAAEILSAGEFDQAVLQKPVLKQLIERRSPKESNDSDWRRSIAAVVHDLHGVLSALAELLHHLAEQETPDNGRAETIKDSIVALAAFAEELMNELTERETGHPTAVDLESAIEAAAVLVYASAAERTQRLVIDIDPETSVVEVNPSGLRRALKNVLEFATSRSADKGVVTIRSQQEGDDCLVSVSFVGEALTTSERRKLFSRPAGGTSVPPPLVLAQDLVDGFGGRMWIESEKSGAASVFIAIPQALRTGAVTGGRRNS